MGSDGSSTWSPIQTTRPAASAGANAGRARTSRIGHAAYTAGRSCGKHGSDGRPLRCWARLAVGRGNGRHEPVRQGAEAARELPDAGGGSRPRLDTELFEDVLEMLLNRARARAEDRCDITVALADGDPAEDVQLASAHPELLERVACSREAFLGHQKHE